MTIAIFGNTQKSRIREEIEHLLDFFQRRGVDVLLSQELRQEFNLRDYPAFDDAKGEVEFALSVGGDGTFLTTAAAIIDTNIPVLGINYGHLGFLAEVETKDVDNILDQLIAGRYTIEQRSLLHISGVDGNRQIDTDALNEVALMKSGLSSMLTIDTYVNDELLNTYEADGLVIATPTGSTAYNMSVGGPIMVPQARGILLSPIASHSLHDRPIVVPDDWQIDLRVRSRNRNYMLSVDGRSLVVTQEMKLHIEKSKKTVKLVQIGDRNFIRSLRDKLGWGSGK